MNQVPIEDPGDQRLEPYMAVRERDLVGRDGLFIAEGKVVLDKLFAARRFSVDSVLVLEKRLPGLAETLAPCPDDVPVYAVSQSVMDQVAGFHIHRGVLAVGRRGQDLDIEESLAALPQNARVIVLVGISNHDNVGAIFRNAAAFGVDAVYLDRTCCDPLYRKAIRASVGAALSVPFCRTDDISALFERLASAGFEQLALSPAGVTDILDVGSQARVALYLGSEGDGLPASLLERMETVKIKMAAGFDSLNVAAASAIALHHLSAG